MKCQISGANALIIVLAAAGLGSLSSDPSELQSSKKVERQPQTGGIAVLSAVDEISAAFDFNSGSHVSRFEDSQLDLDSAEIVFELLRDDPDQDWLSYGFVDKQEVQLLDLGDIRTPVRTRSSDLSPKLSVSAFFSIFRQGAGLYFRMPGEKVNRIHEADEVFGSLPSAKTKHIVPQVGHVYVMRFSPRGNQADADRMIKFRILEHRPNQSITIRWSPIPEESL